MLKRSKVLVCLLLAVVLVIFPANYTAQATEPITVVLDGEALEFDVPPAIINGRTMVPMRVIFEALGAEVAWNAETSTVTATTDTLTVQTTIGNSTISVNGANSTMDVAPVLIDGRTLVPVRFVSEALGAEVEWDATTRTVTIFPGDATSNLTPLDRLLIGSSSFWEADSLSIESVRSFSLYRGEDFKVEHVMFSILDLNVTDIDNMQLLYITDSVIIDAEETITDEYIIYIFIRDGHYYTLVYFHEEGGFSLHFPLEDLEEVEGAMTPAGIMAQFLILIDEAAIISQEADGNRLAFTFEGEAYYEYLRAIMPRYFIREGIGSVNFRLTIDEVNLVAYLDDNGDMQESTKTIVATAMVGRVEGTIVMTLTTDLVQLGDVIIKFPAYLDELRGNN